jgi:cytochrome c peroxidase
LLTEMTLDPDLENGRRLFSTSVSSEMVNASAGVSCSTCHFEGRNDGLNWKLEDGDRNTPSLAGVVSVTAPVTWTTSVASVAEEAILTSEGRMGGDGLAEADALDISTWIDAGRSVELAPPDADAIGRGAALFFDEVVACGECHPAPLYTDLQSHALFDDTLVDTPSLLGSALTAPYLHDGSAQTLEALLRRPEMGGSSDLTEVERADMAAFIRAL